MDTNLEIIDGNQAKAILGITTNAESFETTFKKLGIPHIAKHVRGRGSIMFFLKHVVLEKKAELDRIEQERIEARRAALATQRALKKEITLGKGTYLSNRESVDILRDDMARIEAKLDQVLAWIASQNTSEGASND